MSNRTTDLFPKALVDALAAKRDAMHALDVAIERWTG